LTPIPVKSSAGGRASNSIIELLWEGLKEWEIPRIKLVEARK